MHGAMIRVSAKQGTRQGCSASISKMEEEGGKPSDQPYIAGSRINDDEILQLENGGTTRLKRKACTVFWGQREQHGMHVGAVEKCTLKLCQSLQRISPHGIHEYGLIHSHGWKALWGAPHMMTNKSAKEAVGEAFSSKPKGKKRITGPGHIFCGLSSVQHSSGKDGIRIHTHLIAVNGLDCHWPTPLITGRQNVDAGGPQKRRATRAG